MRTSTTPAVLAEGLTKTYGRRRGLDRLDLRVEPGEVFGYLGANGAGKSTTIRCLLDLIRPTAGRLEVLGLRPRAEAVALHRRIGYLAGDFVADRRQSVRQCLDLLAGLRGGVPRTEVDRLCERLDLDPSTRIGQLSKGNRQKVGLVQAFMHRPELLVLDEPTSGLDPLLQHTFVTMVREAKANGQTVFMSSHVMAEVEAVADRVGIIRSGRMVAVDTVESLREQAVRQVRVVFDSAGRRAPFDPAELTGVDGLDAVMMDADTLRCRLSGSPDALLAVLARHHVVSLLVEEADLEDVVLAYYAAGGDDETGAHDAA